MPASEADFVGVTDPAVIAATAPAPSIGLVGERGLQLRSAPTPQAPSSPRDVTAEPSAVPVVWAPPANVEHAHVEPAHVEPGHVEPGHVEPGQVEPTGAALRTDSSTPAAVQRRTSPLLPLQGLGENYQAPPPSPARTPTDPGTVAVAAGIAQRMPDGSVVFEPPAAPQPEPPPPPVQPEPAPVQRTEAHTTAPTPTPPESTDELVRRLIDPLGRLLRAEIRLDRERAGLRFDTHPYH
ncbi:hypothetical protein [Kitasatospora sp. NPDC093558]|uniref:hypothetical protein n=1 Tax=Kitasatospora sp. NPDC093558 TaxID=3155201 RepID=UPI00344A4353